MGFNSIYRAKVVNNKDPEKLGRVMVWVPDIMHEIPEDKGLWASPANNPIGGRNKEEGTDNNYMGTCYVPKKGSYVFVFFECGNPNRPWYFGSLELDSSKSLPECQSGNYQDKWVVFKSHEGRCIVISDDPGDARVEITGKKRQLNNPPDGDAGSVYTIDGNQTTILLDERDGKEKILIRTYKGDFFNIDVDAQTLNAKFKTAITMETKDFYIKADNTINFEAGTSINNVAPKIGIKAGDRVDVIATTSVNTDAPMIIDNAGSSQPLPLKTLPPKGDR